MQSKNSTVGVSDGLSAAASLLLVVFFVLPAAVWWSDGLLAALQDPRGFLEVLWLVVESLISA